MKSIFFSFSPWLWIKTNEIKTNEKSWDYWGRSQRPFQRYNDIFAKTLIVRNNKGRDKSIETQDGCQNRRCASLSWKLVEVLRLSDNWANRAVTKIPKLQFRRRSVHMQLTLMVTSLDTVCIKQFDKIQNKNGACYLSMSRYAKLRSWKSTHAQQIWTNSNSDFGRVVRGIPSVQFGSRDLEHRDSKSVKRRDSLHHEIPRLKARFADQAEQIRWIDVVTPFPLPLLSC